MNLLLINEVEDMQEMKIKYGGGNEIEANTYINSLIHFTQVVQEVNKGLSNNKKVEVKIKANKEGSFIVDLIIQSHDIIETVKQIFTNDNVTYAAGLIYVVSEAYKVAKHLKGKKPKIITNDKDNIVKIENNEGHIQVFDFRGANIYLNNPLVKEAIAQEFETLEADPKVTELEFLDKNEKPIVEIKRSEFYQMSTSGRDIEPKPNEKIQSIKANLNISSLDWEFKKKWEFYYLGNKISAKIKDDTFGDRINKGERFGKGDTLEVDMEIRQEFDESVNAYKNVSYTITNIIKHIERPSQGNLRFSNKNGDDKEA